MKKLIAIILSLVLAASALPVVSAGEPLVYEEMLQRAESIVNYEWIPKVDIATWNDNLYNGLNYFPAGQIVKGMPYTLFYRELGVDSLVSLEEYTWVSDENVTATAYSGSVGEMRTGPLYGSCCATFASNVLGGNFMRDINPVYDNVRDFYKNELAYARLDVKAWEIYPGDVLINATDTHVMWVGSVTEKTITIYEQMPPVARKMVIDRGSMDAEGHLVYDGRVYPAAARSYELEHSGPHTIIQDAEVSATCETGGLSAGTHCGICGQIFTWQRALSPKGHTFKEISRAEATATEDGRIEYRCSTCGKTKTDGIPSANCAAGKFEDVGFDWYHEGVDFMVQEGYMNGMSETEFSLTTSVTRGQLATILYRIAGAPKMENKPLPFTDVPKGAYYEDAVRWAYENKVVNGMSETEFGPDLSATREQIVTILYRYEGEPEGAADLTKFPDGVTVSDWAVKPVSWAVSTGLLTGSAMEEGVFLLPQQNATRAQIAVMLMRFMQK